jgi:moderate conductance mechanosensitive channel
MDALALEQIRDDALWILLIIVGGLLVLRFARAPIRRVLMRVFENQTRPGSTERLTPAEVQKRVDTVDTLALSTIRFVVAILVVVLVLAVLNLGPVIAGLGIVLAAIAFAGQDFVRDYLAGLVILLENHYYVGDVLQVGTISGTVEDFSLRRAKLRDLDGTLHIVANGEIRIASNKTRGFGGINLDMPIAYDADIDRAMALIGEVGTAMAADPDWSNRIIEAPAALRVEAFGELGMSIKVVGKVQAGEQWAVTGELRRRVLAAFADAGISLPLRNLGVDRDNEDAHHPDAISPPASGRAKGPA